MRSGPIAVTMGDASGVGPEIVLRRAAEGALIDGTTVIYGDTAILATPVPDGPVDANRADAEVARLEAQVSEVAAKAPALGAIIVLGGDTAAALLGTAPARVLGSVAPGTAWLVSPRYRLPVVTRAGGFGDERALADLLWGTLRS